MPRALRLQIGLRLLQAWDALPNRPFADLLASGGAAEARRVRNFVTTTGNKILFSPFARSVALDPAKPCKCAVSAGRHQM